jgi:hypothetical protein
VLPARPGQGDLEIRGEVTTPLHARNLAGAAGVRFALGDGRDVVQYGKAFAVDANGNRTDVSVACDGSAITLRVPAACLAGASYPLTIDPLINNVLLETGAPVSDVDVLCESLSAQGSQARTWVVYSRTVAANDNDLWIRRYGSLFGGSGLLMFSFVSLDDCEHGRIALAPGVNKTVTVFNVQTSGTSSLSWVGMHTHDVNDLFQRNLNYATPFFPVAGEGDWRPEIGGHIGPTGNLVAIVYQKEFSGLSNPFSNTANSAVYCTIFNATTETIGVPPFVIRSRPNRDQERPAINRSAAGTKWLVAYQENDGTVANDDWDVGVVEVDNTGVVGSNFLTTEEANTNTLHKLGPKIAGADGRYCLLYTTQQFQLPHPKPSNVLGEEVKVQRIDWDHSTGTGTLPHPAVTLQSLPVTALRAGGIDFDYISASHWCVDWHNLGNGAFKAAKLGYHGQAVETFTVLAAASLDVDEGSVAFDAENREYKLAYATNDSAVLNNSVLYGQRITYDTVPAASTYGLACGSGTFGQVAEIANHQQIGAQGLNLVLENAPEDGLAFLFISLGAASQPLDPLGMNGCTGLIDLSPTLYLGAVSAWVTSGTASVSLDLPETLVPLPFYFQWAYPATGANALNYQASDGLRVDLGR